MKKSDWLKLIKENEEKIVVVAKKTYKESLNNTHLRFIVEINDDGEVYSWCDSGNSLQKSTFEGKSIELMKFCFECTDYTEEEKESILEECAENEILGKLELIIDMIKSL